MNPPATEPAANPASKTLPSTLIDNQARIYQGITIYGKHIDGTLKLDQSGLEFTDQTGHQVFKYQPEDLKYILFDYTSQVRIKPLRGRAVRLTMSWILTNETVGAMQAAGGSNLALQGATGALTGAAQKAAELAGSIEMGAAAATAASVSHSDQQSNPAYHYSSSMLDTWINVLKAYHYPVNRQSFKKFALIFVPLFILATILFAVLATYIHK